MKNRVKFARGKSISEALNSEDTGTIYFTEDQSIVMGGKIYGKTLEDTKKDFLDKLYDEYIQSLFTVSSAVSKSTVNPGTEVTITIYTKNNGISCSADSRVIGNGFLGDSVFNEVKPGVYVATVPISTVGISSATVTAIYSGIKKNTTVTVSCYKNIIYGWSSLEKLTGASDLRGAVSVGPSSSSVGEYSFTNTDIGYYYILIPYGTSIASSLSEDNPQGTEGPIPVYFIQQTIPGYVVYRIADAQAPSSHKIKFS